MDNAIEQLVILEKNINKIMDMTEEYSIKDPDACMNKARQVAEGICRHTIIKNEITQPENVPTQFSKMIDLLQNPKKKYGEVIDAPTLANLTVLQKWGNMGSHFKNYELTAKDISPALEALKNLVEWFFRENESEMRKNSSISTSTETNAEDEISRLQTAMQDISKAAAEFNASSLSHIATLQMTSEHYFRSNMNDISCVKSVDMVFHSGFEWIMGENVGLIDQLLAAGVHIRIMINTTKALNSIAQYMKQEKRYYPKHKDTITGWKSIAANHPEQVEIRLSSIPFLRRYYSFHMEDATKDTICIKHYTYGNGKMSNNLQELIAPGSRYFVLFRNEFEFLWDRAVP